jgi:hypothetical protein
MIKQVQPAKILGCIVLVYLITITNPTCPVIKQTDAMQGSGVSSCQVANKPTQDATALHYTSMWVQDLLGGLKVKLVQVQHGRSENNSNVQFITPMP